MTELAMEEFCFSTPRIIIAHVTRLDHHADAAGTGDFLHRIGDLLGEIFLNLQATSEHVGDAGKFRQA